MTTDPFDFKGIEDRVLQSYHIPRTAGIVRQSNPSPYSPYSPDLQQVPKSRPIPDYHTFANMGFRQPNTCHCNLIYYDPDRTTITKTHISNKLKFKVTTLTLTGKDKPLGYFATHDEAYVALAKLKLWFGR